MKKSLALVVLFGLCLSVRAEDRLMKLAFRDFSMVPGEVLRPLSVGVCSVDGREFSMTGGFYLNGSLVSLLGDHLRLGAGMVMSPEIKIRPDLTISTRLGPVEIGLYRCFFFGLFPDISDDPWGGMIGYAFKF